MIWLLIPAGFCCGFAGYFVDFEPCLWIGAIIFGIPIVRILFFQSKKAYILLMSTMDRYQKTQLALKPYKDKMKQQILETKSAKQAERQFRQEEESKRREMEERDAVDAERAPVNCPACHSAVSKKAHKCPSCGHPINTEIEGDGCLLIMGLFFPFILFILGGAYLIRGNGQKAIFCFFIGLFPLIFWLLVVAGLNA